MSAPHHVAPLRSVAAKLVLIVAIALVAVALLVGVGVVALRSVTSKAVQLERLNSLTRQGMEADMAHDAIRGDVLRAKLSGAPEADEIRSDFADHSKIMTSVLADLTGTDVPEPVRAAAAQVAPDIQKYLDLAGQTITAALRSPPQTGPFDQFSTQFSVVEDGLPSVADTLDTLAGEASAAVGRQRHRATVTLVSTGLLALFVLGVACRWIARRILVPLREVSAVLAGLANGDLTRSATATTADEMGQMGSALNAAISSVRATIGSLAEATDSVSGAATHMIENSERIVGSAADAGKRVDAVTVTAGQVSRHVETVAASGEEMAASIREIGQNAAQAVQVVAEAVTTAKETAEIMSKLGDSSAEIGNVIRVITSIAEQTNLLALNATIEAARAGAAGKGFAVVAGEVKDLAQETAKATEDISRRVQAIQADAASARAAIGQIGAVIQRIDDYQTTIAGAVEEQSATTNETNRNLAEAAGGSRDIATNMALVTTVTDTTVSNATNSLESARDLSRTATQLGTLVTRFRLD